MIDRVDAKAFAAALETCWAVAPHKSVMPILRNVRLRCEPGSVELAVTTLSVWVRVRVPAACSAKGEVLLDAATLRSVVKGAKGDVSITSLGANDQAVLARVGAVASRIPTMSSDDFPVLSDSPPEVGRVTSANLLALFDATDPCRGTDVSRWHGQGFLLRSVGDGAALLAETTNRHMLARAWRPALVDDLSGIVPHGVVAPLRRLLHGAEQCTFGCASGVFEARTAAGSVGAKLVDAGWPDSDQVIPTTHKYEVTLDRAKSLAACKQMAQQKMRGVRFSFGDKPIDEPAGELRAVTLSAENGDGARIEVGNVVEWAPNGGGEWPRDFGLDVSYLRGVVAACQGDSVVLRGSGPEEPVRIDQLQGVYVIMSIRV